jgi:hypothetical protein
MWTNQLAAKCLPGFLINDWRSKTDSSAKGFQEAYPVSKMRRQAGGTGESPDGTRKDHFLMNSDLIQGGIL